MGQQGDSLTPSTLGNNEKNMHIKYFKNTDYSGNPMYDCLDYV